MLNPEPFNNKNQQIQQYIEALNHNRISWTDMAEIEQQNLMLIMVPN